jgi:2-polyprenyl-3-methyl-5-hydroxy-6-metoxy-1,4-benzoquinol methylase
MTIIKRDYNKELDDSNAAENKKYSYNFDFDVMHPFMIDAFKIFFVKGNLLELGSYQGQFTQHFLKFFKDITCIEVSSDAIQIAKNKFKDKINFFQSTFEEVTLPKKYDNIILTHTLEHLDDPVKILKRINDEWLSRNGRLFLVCPNANAPSRQIAVKMGLIMHNTEVTVAEKKHGHRRTYSLDTLEADAVKSGLDVKYRTGIFFKALANFQWDKLLKTDIISREYLDGCYKLGHLYPDLCSSIFILCQRRKKQL